MILLFKINNNFKKQVFVKVNEMTFKTAGGMYSPVDTFSYIIDEKRFYI